jgi:hypothetical protein
LQGRRDVPINPHTVSFTKQCELLGEKRGGREREKEKKKKKKKKEERQGAEGAGTARDSPLSRQHRICEFPKMATA